MSFWFLCLAYTPKTTRSGLWHPDWVMTLQMNLTSVLKFDVNVKSRPPVRDTLAMSCESPFAVTPQLFCTSGPRTSRQIPHQHARVRVKDQNLLSSAFSKQSYVDMGVTWSMNISVMTQRTIWHFTKFISYLSDTDYDQNLIRPTCKIALITQCGGALRDWNTPGTRKTVDSGVWDLSRVTGTL